MEWKEITIRFLTRVFPYSLCTSSKSKFSRATIVFTQSIYNSSTVILCDYQNISKNYKIWLPWNNKGFTTSLKCCWTSDRLVHLLLATNKTLYTILKYQGWNTWQHWKFWSLRTLISNSFEVQQVPGGLVRRSSCWNRGLSL